MLIKKLFPARCLPLYFGFIIALSLWLPSQLELASATAHRTGQPLNQPSFTLNAADQVWSASNSGQNFNLEFSANGIHFQQDASTSSDVHPDLRFPKNPPVGLDQPFALLPSHKLQWQTSAFGRKGAMHALPAVQPNLIKNRMCYQRLGILEWYENKPEGLEQGFVIQQRPTAHHPADAWAQIESAPFSGWQVQTTDQGQAVELSDPQGRVLMRYAELKAWDAKHRTLPICFRVENKQIILAYNDADAEYPVHIDPIISTPAWQQYGGQTNAYLGSSVASAGDVNGDGYGDVLVSIPYYDNGQEDEGRLDLYLGSASGLNPAASWSVEGNSASAKFGYSAATAGDVNNDGYNDVIVGAPGYVDQDPDVGFVYVYLGSSSGLSLTPSWSQKGPEGNCNYGFSVACAGDVNNDGFSDILVSAPLFNGTNNTGRVWVYPGSASGINSTPLWFHDETVNNAYFGWCVASAGDVNSDGYVDIAVGAPNLTNDQSAEGRVYVFLNSSTGISHSPWAKEGNLNNAAFGISLASAGDVNRDGYGDLIVGVSSFTNGESQEGAAYVYLGSASGLSAAPNWTAEGNQSSAHLGTSVASAGDVNGDGYGDVIVGAPNYANGQSNEGQVRVYLGNSTGLNLTPVWSPEGNSLNATFGYAVSSAGDVNGDGYSDLLVGASTYVTTHYKEGRATVYLGGAYRPLSAATLRIESNQTDANMGSCITMAGDVNGDGYGDVLMAAQNFDFVYSNVGRVTLHLGSTNGLNSAPIATYYGNQINSLFGWSMAQAGDVNGDGYGDVVIGAPNYDNGEPKEGRAYVYLGSAGGLGTTPVWNQEGNQSNANFGSSVASAGDINNDGYSDVLIGVPGYGNGETDEGQALLYLGSATGLAATPVWSVESNSANAHFGSSVASAGDINADGYDDVIIGASRFSNGESEEGRVFVYLGSAQGLATAPAWFAESNQANALFGTSVSTAGDINNDGYSDIIIGAPYYTAGSLAKAGRLYLYCGSATGLSSSPTWTFEGLTADSNLGFSVAPLGDISADGYDDVMVGVPNDADNDCGTVYIFRGAASGLLPYWEGTGNQSNAWLGFSVASVGDINGDGIGEFAAGAPGYTNGQNNEGQVWIWDANQNVGSRIQLKQSNADNTRLLGPAGHASEVNNNTQARVKAWTRCGQVRTRAKLQVEAVSIGKPFTGTNLHTQTGYTDIDAAGKELDMVLNLNPNQAYHWRSRLLFDPQKAPNGLLHTQWYQMAWGSLSGSKDFATGKILPTPTPAPTMPPAPPTFFKAYRSQINPIRNEAVTLTWSQPQTGPVTITIYNLLGDKIINLCQDQTYAEGRFHSLTWNGTNQDGAIVGSGIYIVHLKANTYETYVKVAVIK